LHRNRALTHLDCLSPELSPDANRLADVLGRPDCTSVLEEAYVTQGEASALEQQLDIGRHSKKRRKQSLEHRCWLTLVESQLHSPTAIRQSLPAIVTENLLRECQL
jgi:hypothetical protein